jgi:hypothetical protein
MTNIAKRQPGFGSISHQHVLLLMSCDLVSHCLVASLHPNGIIGQNFSLSSRAIAVQIRMLGRTTC